MTSESELRVQLIQDVSPAAWLADGTADFGVAASLVPTGFDAYVQILHPAESPSGRRVRWREVADALQAPLLPGVWFQDLEKFAEAGPSVTRPWDCRPDPGTIPDAVLDVLTPVLGRHTTAQRGWFCLWDGWGFLHGSMWSSVAWPVDHQPPPGTPSTFQAQPAFPPEVLNGPKVRLPAREYFLFEGPLDAVGELGAFVSWEPGGHRSFERQTPSLWWPADRAWCAGNEVDAGFTCIGGGRVLIDELLGHPELETLELDPTVEFSPYRELDDT